MVSGKARVMSIFVWKKWIGIHQAAASFWAEQEEAAFQEYGGVKLRGILRKP